VEDMPLVGIKGRWDAPIQDSTEIPTDQRWVHSQSLGFDRPFIFLQFADFYFFIDIPVIPASVNKCPQVPDIFVER
jgi:hypothetical protein